MYQQLYCIRARHRINDDEKGIFIGVYRCWNHHFGNNNLYILL